MAEPLTPVAVIDGRSGRKLNNALTITFSEGSEPPFGKAQQGAGDGFGGKLGILFGFRNGSVGNHQLTFTDGSKLHIPTRDLKPTTIRRTASAGSATDVAIITRGPETVATLPDGTELLRFVPHPTEAETTPKYRMHVLDPSGARVADLDVMRTNAGWTIDAEDIIDVLSGDFGGSPGGSLPIPFLGTRLVIYRDVTQAERDVLLAACCEIALAVRPYMTAMGERGAAWT